ncbi:hypothetical protein [Demequina capsici]|uniref:Uncharacterized protein n=1 Tax=Demequina capsici TaxID=3075620 RepID=A0AA96FBJ2_9MICO|nr:hypothetical protein [Demequina sp. OYTSA14]WNM25250.1 hypothetical protein RN606_03625 [Demequina sp. OYTSA14]
MGDEAPEPLEVTVARIEERLIAQGARIGRLEGMIAVVAVAIVGAIVTAAARVL